MTEYNTGRKNVGTHANSGTRTRRLRVRVIQDHDHCDLFKRTTVKLSAALNYHAFF
jgi:hypothetical protein